MRATPAHSFDKSTDVHEPIEIRTVNKTRRHVAVLARNDSGLVRLVVYTANGSPLAISELQSPGFLPGKAVPGWQAEVIGWISDSLYGEITEIR